jgi:tetratricopeptide (TPR) repeat protein
MFNVHRLRLPVAGLLISTLATLGCTPSPPPPEGEELAVLVEGSGTYTRPISTDSELAQQFFDQGLRLTWGYHFPEAVASHQEAARHDPDHPMIYWGLALCLGPNPNSRINDLPDDPQGEAKKAIDRAMELIDNGNEVERAFVETLHIRFDSDTHPEREARDQAYLAAARALSEKYPEDPDAGVLLGDAYMITRPGRFYWDEGGQPLVGTADAAAALERVMQMRPDHPGGNHLYLHLFESSNTPEQALPAAERLAPLMPGVGHVVHMPSHIYVRVGQHARAFEQNQRSTEADVEFLAAWGDLPFPQTGTYFLSAQNHRRHSYDFMRYSAAVLGSYGRAVKAATDARAHEPEKRIRRGAARKTIASRWLVHKMFGRWDELRSEERVLEGAQYLDGLWNYTQGSAQVGLGELEEARESLKRLRAVAADPVSATIRRNMNPASKVLELAAFGLEGEIKQAKGDLDGAIAAFRSAVEIQDGLAYMEPPDWPQPMRHYLGAALLEKGKAAEAEREYRRDLESNRNDGWGLFGLWQSLEAQGKTEEARKTRQAYEQVWQDADVELTRSRF